VIDLRFHRGLSQGQQLRRLLTEFVRIAERENLIRLKEPVVVEVVPCVSVHGAFGFWQPWSGGEQTILIAGRDYATPRNKAEAQTKETIVAKFPALHKVPFIRRVCWTLGHELAHASGVEDEAEADTWGLRLLEAARAKSAVLRSGTRKQ
jgi:hypothetical protein